MTFLKSQEIDSLEAMLEQKGCYSSKENLRIYKKWFAAGPRFMFRTVDQKYGLTRKVIADVGCAYGTNLVHCTPTSYGIEIEDYEIQFARSIGLQVYRRNILTDDLSDLPKVEAVWCSAVLEHVDSPHVFLRKLYQLLVPGGLLAIYVPTIPLFPGLRRLPRIGRLFGGHLHGDHINAFVPSTLRFFCEYAGFDTLEVGPFLNPPLSLLRWIPLADRMVDGCIYVGKKIDNWAYPQNSTRRASNNTLGYEFIGQVFGTQPDAPES